MDRSPFGAHVSSTPSASGYCNPESNSDHDKTSMIRRNFHLQQQTLATLQPVVPLDPLTEFLRSEKHANVTEAIPVPSSEHVAEIVGRQGCKIKELRSKTRTYIKTPQKNEEPIFVVTGRQEDVAEAKASILTASDHFTKIRANRRALGEARNGLASRYGRSEQSLAMGNGEYETGPEGQVTRYVEVPMNLVGLVVGPRGATIKEIQEKTNTYIVSPGRDDAAVFKVIGQPEDVSRAEDQIKNFVRRRLPCVPFGSRPTKQGSQPLGGVPSGHSSDILNASGQFLPSTWNTLSAGLDLLPSNHSAPLSFVDSLNSQSSALECALPLLQPTSGFSSIFGNMELNLDDPFGTAGIQSQATTASACLEGLNALSLADSINKANTQLLREKGLSESLSPPLSMPWRDTDGLNTYHDQALSPGCASLTQQLNRTSTGLHNHVGQYGYHLQNGVANSLDSSAESSPLAVGTPNFGRPKTCMVCQQQDAMVTLAPCGHHLYCQECGENIMTKSVENRKCPFCWQDVSVMYTT